MCEARDPRRNLCADRSRDGRLGALDCVGYGVMSTDGVSMACLAADSPFGDRRLRSAWCRLDSLVMRRSRECVISTCAPITGSANQPWALKKTYEQG